MDGFLQTLRINETTTSRGRKLARLRATVTERMGMPEVELHGLSHSDAMITLLDWFEIVLDNLDDDSLVPFKVSHGNSKWMRDYCHRLIRSKRFVIRNDVQEALGNFGMSIVYNNPDFEFRLEKPTPEQKEEWREEDLRRIKKLLLPVGDGKDYQPIMRMLQDKKDLKIEGEKGHPRAPGWVLTEEWNSPIDFDDPDSFMLATARHITRVGNGYWEPDVDCDGTKVNVGDLVWVHPHLYQQEGRDLFSLDVSDRFENENNEFERPSDGREIRSNTMKQAMVVLGMKMNVPVDDDDQLHNYVVVLPPDGAGSAWFRFEQVKVVSSRKQAS